MTQKARISSITAALLLVVMMFSLTIPVSAASAKVDSRIRQLLYYYQYYQDKAEADIDRLIQEITEIDPDQGDKWRRIMDFWSWMNREMEKVPDCLPDGLPEDDSLCIVVLGYGLNSDGSMKKELVGRMETALRSAQKYPNAYILCTGGGTAGNRTVTEAGQMARWLINNGIDESRIIRETNSRNTAQNAQYSCRILREQYPQVHSIAIVTSSYHVRRGYLVFNTESVLTNSGLEIVGNAMYVDNRGVTETFTYQAYEISQLLTVGYKEGASWPPLSRLESISAEGESVCQLGQEPAIRVLAHYNTDFSRDVTSRCSFSGIDFGMPGVQTMTIAYTENDKTFITEFEIEILVPETEPPTEPPTEAPTEPPVPETEPAPVEAEKSGIARFFENLWDSLTDVFS